MQKLPGRFVFPRVQRLLVVDQRGEPPAQRLHRFGKLGTIDLRIDYLRPCVGEYFKLSAEVLRLGSRVANTRMAFAGADGKLLCVGAGAYIVS